MKNAFILLSLFSLILLSCNEDPNDVTVVDTQGSFSVDLSGDKNETYTQDSLVAYLHSGLIIVKAYDASENVIWVFLDTSIASEIVGTHQIARFDAPAQININYADGSNNFSAESGTLTISAYDQKSIKGTFAFQAKDLQNTSVTLAGTNGQFSAVLK